MEITKNLTGNYWIDFSHLGQRACACIIIIAKPMSRTGKPLNNIENHDFDNFIFFGAQRNYALRECTAQPNLNNKK